MQQQGWHELCLVLSLQNAQRRQHLAIVVALQSAQQGLERGDVELGKLAQVMGAARMQARPKQRDVRRAK
jgi:hypothetical protein